MVTLAITDTSAHRYPFYKRFYKHDRLKLATLGSAVPDEETSLCMTTGVVNYGCNMLRRKMAISSWLTAQNL